MNNVVRHRLPYVLDEHDLQPWQRLYFLFLGYPAFAPTAGIVYELSGPDPQSVTMPPAPALGSTELAYEMAEVYELALLRDVRLTEFGEGSADPAVNFAKPESNGVSIDNNIKHAFK
jgi:hypothetical protein